MRSFLPKQVSNCFKTLLLGIIAVLAAWSTPTNSQAQGHGVTSYGTDFWMGFMPDYTFSADFVCVFICSGTANHVVIEQYGGGSGGPTRKFTYDLVPNTAQTVLLDVSSAENWQTETPTYHSVHVTATNPLAVYGFSNQYATSDGFLALPTPALGTEYYTANFNDDWYSAPSEPLAGQFLIVAPFDNTNVTITTTSDTRLDRAGNIIGHQKGQTWSVSLNRAQTYLVQAPGRDKDNDITGSHVTSDKPIVLLSGHQRCSIPNDDPVYNSKDMLIEMLPSLDKWGTQYFDMPMKGRTKCGDYIRLISGVDNNDITVNGGTHVFISKGEYVERTYVLAPEVYTSVVKGPFLTMQYSYTEGVNGDPGTADPFMITMTPQEEFQKLMIFRTPKNPNTNGDYTHYATFVGQADSLMNIELNGKTLQSWGAAPPQIFSGTNPPMGATRLQLQPGEKTYIASSGAPFGAYLYGFTSVDGYGWPAGMALNIPSPDTLPPLQTNTVSCGDYAVTLAEVRHIPQFSFEDTRISEVDLIKDAGDPRWPKPSSNYALTVDPKFQSGDSSAKFTLNVIDPRVDAYAAIYTVDRAGNDTVYEYSYSAPKYAAVPAPDYDYGFVTVDQDSCKTITITNKQVSGDLNLTTMHLAGSAQAGSYSFTPKTLPTLKPGESTQLSICYHPSDTGVVSRDTLSFTVGSLTTTNCVPDTFRFTGVGVTPLIYAEDLNFGVIDSGQTRCLDMKVTNVGKATLTITKQDLLNTADFSVNPSQVFPIVLAPGQSTTINYCFHPTKTGLFSTNALFTTLNPVKFAHSVKDTSLLIGQASSRGAQLTSYVKDFNASCGQKPTIVDTVFDPQTTGDELIDSVSVTGPDAASFSVLGYAPNNPYPYILGRSPNPGVEYSIQFDPTVKGMTAGIRNAFFNVYGHSGEHLIATLKADSKAPQLTLLPGTATAVDLGTTLVNQTLTGQFVVKNTGNDVMTVGSVTPAGADAANFTVAPVGPYTLLPGDSVVETITFTAGALPRVYTTGIDVTPTGTACAALESQPVKATASATGYLVQGADYKTVFTCKSKSLSGWFTNISSSETATLLSVAVANVNGWTDVTDFQQVPAVGQNLTVAPGDSVLVPVLFTPTATGVRNAGLVFTYATPKDTETQIAQLTGVGDNIQEVVGAGSVTASQTFTGHANDPISVDILMSKPFQPTTNEVYGYDFKVSWQEDAFQFGSVVSPNGISVTPVGTPVVDPVTHIETHEFKGVSQNPLTTETLLGTLKMLVMLDTGSSSAIVPLDVHYLDQTGAPICYIATTPLNGGFNFVSRCGDATIQSMLGSDRLVLSIAQLDPNPSKALTRLEYEVREPAANVTVSVFDALGNEVRRILDNAPQRSGRYSAVFDASKVSSGSYFVRVSDGTNTATRELIISK